MACGLITPIQNPEQNTTAKQISLLLSNKLYQVEAVSHFNEPWAVDQSCLISVY
jgi:hypothetical protein